jgi:hypothetical protein
MTIKWDNYINYVFLFKLFKVYVDQKNKVRLDSLGLICENPKTTEQILEVEFELVRRFLVYNSDVLSPSFRQSVISFMKRVGWTLKLFFITNASIDNAFSSFYLDSIIKI